MLHYEYLEHFPPEDGVAESPEPPDPEASAPILGPANAEIVTFHDASIAAHPRQSVARVDML